MPFTQTANEKLFAMKYLAAFMEAVELGVKDGGLKIHAR
jgi:hypothetical protein